MPARCPGPKGGGGGNDVKQWYNWRMSLVNLPILLPSICRIFRHALGALFCGFYIYSILYSIKYRRRGVHSKQYVSEFQLGGIVCVTMKCQKKSKIFCQIVKVYDASGDQTFQDLATVNWMDDRRGI